MHRRTYRTPSVALSSIPLCALLLFMFCWACSSDDGGASGSPSGKDAGADTTASDSGTGSEGAAGHDNDSGGGEAGPDECPDDPAKTEPGVCGCGVPDTDENDDGVVDCLAGAGWTDLVEFLVPSDGSRSLGDNKMDFNTERDQGSKIVYFDVDAGDNASAGVYYWDGTRLIDQDGSETNPDNGEAYGTDPLSPNEAAIRPFRHSIKMKGNAEGDPRLRTHKDGFAALAGGYPDWFLYRRGQTHYAFNAALIGGRSEQEPMVVAGYGPLQDGRAKMYPDGDGTLDYEGTTWNLTNPFSTHTSGATTVWMHVVLSGLEFNKKMSYLGTHLADSHAGGPVTLLMEDCAWRDAKPDGTLVYLPVGTTVHRCVLANSYNAEHHNQAYFNSGFKAAPTFDEVIFYRNGYKNNPQTHADPKRDIFSRNIYQGGGAQMGHTYRNIISADGASGGPQMRLGGTCENSLIIEGYWFSATSSNKKSNEWLTSGNQTGQSAVVRNNVQLVYAYPTPNDPDTDDDSDNRAQPGWGYTLQGESFGAIVEGNIISNALLVDDLGKEPKNRGMKIGVNVSVYEQDGKEYSQKNNVFRNNITYRVGTGMVVDGNWAMAENILIEGNVFHGNKPLDADVENLSNSSQLLVQNNRFYADEALPTGGWMGSGNELDDAANAAQAEGWPDPDRTIKRYVTEVLKLTLLDWSDDPYLDPAEVKVRSDAGEAYDPTGLKTFMAVATNMRRGGVEASPSSGKPSWTGDYAWDERFTGKVVVNWIREGFGLPAVP